MTSAERQIDGATYAQAGAHRQPAAAFMPYSLSAIVVALTYVTIDILSPALPAIKDHFALSATGAGLVFSILFLGRLIGNFPASYLLERIGSSLSASAGAALLAAGSLLAALASDVAVLYGARLLQGIGISLLVNAGLRSILQARPGRGSAMTMFGIAATIGGVIGLQSGGVLTDRDGWRAVFALSAGIGVILLVGSLGSYLLGSRKPQDLADQAESIPPSSVPIREYLVPLVFNFLIFCNYSIWVALPLYAKRKFDATAEETAYLLLVITIVHLLAALPAGRLIQVKGSRWVLMAGLLTAMLGTVALVPVSSLMMLAVPLVFYGAGMVASVNSAGDIVLQQGGAGSRAVGSLRLASDLGLVVGPIAAGALADAFGYGAPFIVIPVAMLLAVGFALAKPAWLGGGQLKGRAA